MSIRSLPVLLVLAFLAAPPVAAQEAGEHRTHVLLVGCTEYPKLTTVDPNSVRLDGPTHDIPLLRQQLERVLGVRPADVTVLLGWPDDPAARPTKANIVSHLTRLATAVKKGDRAVLYLAGHGSRQPDATGDEIDGWDEIFLPADVTDWEKKAGAVTNAISDDELGRHVHSIRNAGAQVWLILDCCHAGTLVRGAGDSEVRTRGLAPRLLSVPDRPGPTRRPDGDRSVVPFEADLRGIIAMYGSQSHRPALEMKLPRGAKDREWRGLFSYVLIAQLRQLSGNPSFEEFYARVLAAFQAEYSTSTMPWAEGDLSMPMAGPGQTLVPSFRVRKEEAGIVLDAGRFAGIETGTIMEVFRPGHAGLGEARLGYVEVTEAGLTTSKCRLLARGAFAKPKLEAVCPALVASRPVTHHHLKVAVVSEGDVPVVAEDYPAEVAACVAESTSRVTFVEDPAHASWLVSARPGGGFSVCPAGAASDREALVAKEGKLGSLLERVARAALLKGLVAQGVTKPLPKDLIVKVERILPGDRRFPLGPGELLRPGDRIEILFGNQTWSIYDLTILGLDAELNILDVFPYKSIARLGADDDGMRGIKYTVNDECMGVEHLLALAVPREKTTDPVVSFAFLAREPEDLRTRGVNEDSHSAVAALKELGYGVRTRGMTRMDSEPEKEDVLHASLLSWRTGWGDLGPPPDYPAKPVNRDEPPERDLIDPWSVGPSFAFGKTDPHGPIDLLVTGGEKPTAVLIDLDGDTDPALLAPERAQETVKHGLLDAEAAFHFYPDRRWAFYDTDNLDGFDLLLIDRDGDGIAEERRTKTGEDWTTETGVAVPWLQTAHLTYEGGADQALAKFAILKR